MPAIAVCKLRDGVLEVIRTTSRKVFVPYLAFVYNVEGPCDALGRYINVAIWGQRSRSDPEQFLGNYPFDMLGSHVVPELDHGGGWAKRQGLPGFAPVSDMGFYVMSIISHARNSNCISEQI